MGGSGEGPERVRRRSTEVLPKIVSTAPSWPHFGSSGPVLEPSEPHSGPILAPSEPVQACLGAFLVPFWRHPGPIFAPSGPILAPSWRFLAPCRYNLGPRRLLAPSLPHLRAIWAYLGALLAFLGTGCYWLAHRALEGLITPHKKL